MVKQHLIYALVDPRTSSIRYVGRSSSGLRRPKGYLRAALNRDGFGHFKYTGHVHNWVRALIAVGYEYQIRVLEELDFSDDINDRLNDTERRYVAQLKQDGCDLTNMTDGGEGILNPSEETRRRLRESHLGLHAGEKNPMYGKSPANKGKKDTLEVCEKRRQGRLGKSHTDEAKEKNRQAHLGKVHSMETREKMRISATGRKLTDAEKEKVSVAVSKAVICLNDGKTYVNGRQAGMSYGVNFSTVSNICNGKQYATRSGLRFAFVESQTT